MVTLHFITHIQDYHTHVFSKTINFFPTPFSSNIKSKHKPFSPYRTARFISNTLRLRRKMNKKHIHKYAINQVSQCETEPQAIETTNVIATLYSKARATTVTAYKFTATFSEKKVHCSQVSNGNKNRLDHESFYQSNIERLLHLNPDDCKNELLRLNITHNKNSERKIVNFQVFSDSVHQSQR